MDFKISINFLIIIISFIVLFIVFFNKEESNHEELIFNERIINFNIYDSKGDIVFFFNDEESTIILKNILSSIIKEDNMVNLSNPKYYIDILYANGKEESFHFWIGDSYKQTFLMKVDSKYTVYKLPKEMNKKFNKLLEIE